MVSLFMDLKTKKMNTEILKVVKDLRSDLFYQIESKFGAEKASKYPSIIDADELINKLTIPVVVGSFITAEDEGKYFIVNTDQLYEIEKGSVVYLLNTYPEDIHLFQDKNGDDVWLNADDVDRKD